MLRHRDIFPLIRQALREDGAAHDLTSQAVLPASRHIRAHLIANAPGILAGGTVAAWTFQALDPAVRCRFRLKEGARLRRGQVILVVEGLARIILAAERTALNFVSHLSGIATLTAAYVRRARPSRARIYDTRKTLPGLRLLERHAVRVGGGHNHRAGLHDASLIKTNHLKALGQGARGWGPGKINDIIRKVVVQARRKLPHRFLEVEVRNLSEFKAALGVKLDAILLDNWTISQIRRAVAVRTSPPAPRPRPLVEVSGGVTLANVRAIARTGVERISIGRLTHSAPALDCSLRVV